MTGGENADAFFQRGVALHLQGCPAEALEAYRRALELDAEHSDASYNAGIACQELGLLVEAEQRYARALALRPDFAEASNNLGNVLRDSGRLEEAERSFRRALEIRPDFAEAHSNLIFLLDLVEGGVESHQAERRRWYDRHAGKKVPGTFSHSNSRDPERRLRVGYVSADFHQHSASYLFGPVIRSHDRAAFEVLCYSGGTREDAVTASLRSRADAWRATAGMPDEALADQVRRDGIDILVDLSGYTAGSRLLAFARKPAPVQVTAWGFATGTGIPQIDYFIADPIVVPAEERRHYAEEVFDLPCWTCYEPPEYLPEVVALPALEGKPFTFGSLNRVERMSAKAVRAWSRVLAEVPEATLILKDPALDNPGIREAFVRRLDEAGVAEERVLLLGRTPHDQHLAVYHEIDVALDPFPNGGGVSTAEALWMGVPVVTLLGATPGGRTTASILAHAGMEDWVARTQDDYV